MKSSIPIIILSILLTVSMAVAYNLYTTNKATQEALELQQKTNEEIKNSYNRARAIITDKDIQITILDKKLKAEIGKKPKKIIEKIYIRVADKSSGQGTATTKQNQPDIFTFKDYRLEATVNTKTKIFRYTLDQLFDINIIQVRKEDYRIEIIEKNRLNGDVVRFVRAKEFSVIKKREKLSGVHFGVNLNIGGGGFIGPSLKPYPDLYGTLNFISYGRTHLDSSWRFFSVGAGAKQALVVPVSWNLGSMIQLLSDAWVDLSVGVNWDGKLTGGIGLSSTF